MEEIKITDNLRYKVEGDKIIIYSYLEAYLYSSTFDGDLIIEFDEIDAMILALQKIKTEKAPFPPKQA
jgi:hypothetical protein